jgi:hypothetical protein
MPERTDRSIRENRQLLVIVIGVVIVAAVGGFLFRARTNSADAVQKASGQGLNPLIQPAFRNDPLAVTIYYPQDGLLVSSAASAKRQSDAQAQAQEALASLLMDQQAAQAAVLREIKLRAFYIDSRGTAYIDLTLQKQAIRASAWDEQLAIYAIVNTLMQNFEEIKQVAFLIDGRDAQTLAGHLDLSRKFSKRMDLLRQELRY